MVRLSKKLMEMICPTYKTFLSFAGMGEGGGGVKSNKRNKLGEGGWEFW